MAKRAKKKPIPELDKSIVRELKKNRIFSKTNACDISDVTPDDIYEYCIDFVNNLTDDKVTIYICDKLYTDGDINLLLHVSDTHVLILNNDDIYNRLKEHEFNLTEASIIFYDRN